MTHRDVFELFLDLAVDADDTGPIAYSMMKDFVAAAMARGEWLNEFDRAVIGQEISGEDYRILRQALEKAFPDAHRQSEQIVAVLDEHLSFPFHPIKYLIEDESSIVAANNLCVARIRDGRPTWITPRVSWDGIMLHGIRDGVIEGEWCQPFGGDPDLWFPLKIALDDGRIVEGKVIGF